MSPAMANLAGSRSLPNVPDILYVVFSYLDPTHQFTDGQVYECRQSLAFAARACRRFTGPALDVLWSDYLMTNRSLTFLASWESLREKRRGKISNSERTNPYVVGCPTNAGWVPIVRATRSSTNDAGNCRSLPDTLRSQACPYPCHLTACQSPEGGFVLGVPVKGTFKAALLGLVHPLRDSSPSPCSATSCLRSRATST